MARKDSYVKLSCEERTVLSKALHEKAKSEIFELRRRLREHASTNSFALECWEYYKKNYISYDERKVVFECSYLRGCLRGIEVEGYC